MVYLTYSTLTPHPDELINRIQLNLAVPTLPTMTDMLTNVTSLYLRFFCIVLTPHARRFISTNEEKKTNSIE